MSKETSHTARNFVLQLGSLVALYITLSALIALIFGIITLAYPDDLFVYRYESATDGIRFAIAMLIVFFPTYLIITRYVNKVRRSQSEGAYLGLTRWLIYLSLLVGGGILLGDLVAVIWNFLNGELTTPFMLKALTVLVVIGSAFVYYVLDARGYWQKEEKKSITYGAGATVVVVAAIVLGFFHIELPEERRAVLFDQERVQDLQDIQFRVGEYYRAKQELPTSLTALETIGFGYELPTDPETEAVYEYRVLTTESFELCATFETDSATEERARSSARPFGIEGNWEHGAGYTCFERIIDPDFFKPIQ